MSIVLSLIGAHSDRPVEVTDEDFVASGSASSIEEVAAKLEGEPGSQVLGADVGWILDDGGARSVGTCALRDDAELPTAFLLFGSAAEAGEVVEAGDVRLDRDIVGSKASFVIEGRVLVVGLGSHLVGPAYSAGYEEFDVDD